MKKQRETEIADQITELHQSDDSFEGHNFLDLLWEAGVFSKDEETRDFGTIEVLYYRQRIVTASAMDRIQERLLAMGWTHEEIGTPIIDGWKELKMPVWLSPQASNGPLASLA